MDAAAARPHPRAGIPLRSFPLMPTVVPSPTAPNRHVATNRAALRGVALYEACKGGLVLLLGAGWLTATGQEVQAAAQWLVAQTHLNPASRLPHIFIEAASRPHETHLMWLAAGAGLYALVRLAEAWGLWFDRSWAEVLAAGSGAIYVPFEVGSLLRHPGWGHLLLLLANLGVVALMLWALWQRRSRPALAR